MPTKFVFITASDPTHFRDDATKTVVRKHVMKDIGKGRRSRRHDENNSGSQDPVSLSPVSVQISKSPYLEKPKRQLKQCQDESQLQCLDTTSNLYQEVKTWQPGASISRTPSNPSGQEDEAQTRNGSPIVVANLGFCLVGGAFDPFMNYPIAMDSPSRRLLHISQSTPMSDVISPACLSDRGPNAQCLPYSLRRPLS